MASVSPKGNALLEVGEILINENGPKNNPWECHFFKHQIKTSTNKYFISTVSWSVDANIPLNLSIDNNGIISGQVLPLTTDQPGIAEADFTTKESLKEDGSNWKNIGRFAAAYKDFTFKVTWTIQEYADELMTTPTVVSLDADYTIRVIRNNDVDNIIFCIEYLKAGWTLNLGNKKYDKTMIDQYLKDNSHLTKWDCWKGE
jgi:hypothetical protein